MRRYQRIPKDATLCEGTRKCDVMRGFQKIRGYERVPEDATLSEDTRRCDVIRGYQKMRRYQRMTGDKKLSEGTRRCDVMRAPEFSLAEGGSMLGVSQAVDDFLSLQGSTQDTVPEEQGDDGQENKEDSPIFRQTYTKEDSPIFGPTSSQKKGEIWARDETQPFQKAAYSEQETLRNKKIGAELRSLRKRYRCSSDAEKEGIVQLRERARLKTLTNAERLRRKRREKAKKRTAFTSNPYKYTRSMLSEEKSGKLESSQDEVEQHLRETHSDPHRSETLG
ncbi:hypothetical protein MAR_016877 [Mya arenaria]|uniref:ALMS motif domain-containing protein n=1 Tax=Mya arenaria TaxID=6604 RepID=A0ABY7EER8_MYAAR|nr:hypothetical protein MAR_016877 [Mya arenaria]